MEVQTAHKIAIVHGGVYRKKIGAGTATVTMDATTELPNGKRSGVLRVPGFPAETIHEDGTGATGWEHIGATHGGLTAAELSKAIADELRHAVETRINTLESATQSQIGAMQVELFSALKSLSDQSLALQTRVTELEDRLVLLTSAPTTPAQAPKPKGR